MLKQEFDTRQGVLVGRKMAGKMSKRTNDDLSPLHASAKALTDAGKLANAFNLAVQTRLSGRGRSGTVDPRVWGVQFLSCSTYE